MLLFVKRWDIFVSTNSSVPFVPTPPISLTLEYQPRRGTQSVLLGRNTSGQVCFLETVLYSSADCTAIRHVKQLGNNDLRLPSPPPPSSSLLPLFSPRAPFASPASKRGSDGFWFQLKHCHQLLCPRVNYFFEYLVPWPHSGWFPPPCFSLGEDGMGDLCILLYALLPPSLLRETGNHRKLSHPPDSLSRLPFSHRIPLM